MRGAFDPSMQRTVNWAQPTQRQKDRVCCVAFRVCRSLCARRAVRGPLATPDISYIHSRLASDREISATLLSLSDATPKTVVDLPHVSEVMSRVESISLISPLSPLTSKPISTQCLVRDDDSSSGRPRSSARRVCLARGLRSTWASTWVADRQWRPWRCPGPRWRSGSRRCRPWRSWWCCPWRSRWCCPRWPRRPRRPRKHGHASRGQQRLLFAPLRGIRATHGRRPTWQTVGARRRLALRGGEHRPICPLFRALGRANPYQG